MKTQKIDIVSIICNSLVIVSVIAFLMVILSCDITGNDEHSVVIAGHDVGLQHKRTVIAYDVLPDTIYDSECSDWIIGVFYHTDSTKNNYQRFDDMAVKCKHINDDYISFDRNCLDKSFGKIGAIPERFDIRCYL